MKNMDVVFKLADGHQTLEITSVLDIDVQAPASAGVGVLRDTPPDIGNGPWPGNMIAFWRGDLVAWWRSCPEAEAQAFDVGTNGSVTNGISHKTDAIDPWLKKNKAKIGREAKRHADAVRGRLVAHVKAMLAEQKRAMTEATDLKLEKEDAFDYDRYDAKAAEELGCAILSWSKILPDDEDAIAEFIEAVQHSSIPEAAGEVGDSIQASKRKR